MIGKERRWERKRVRGEENDNRGRGDRREERKEWKIGDGRRREGREEKREERGGKRADGREVC